MITETLPSLSPAQRCDGFDQLVSERFWLVGIFGTVLAVFGMIANASLTILFLTRLNYRHSPFFFLGFVAFYDTLLDCTYIILYPVPTVAEYFDHMVAHNFWIAFIRPVYLLGQISKMSSVFCLIVASFERYFITRHWTFTGFELRTRWIILVIAITLAVSDWILENTANCEHYQHSIPATRAESVFLIGLFNVLSIFLPFVTLIFLNGAIVLMLKRQHIEQLRSLMTELTVGKDMMKIRRHNLRSATHTLIVIITAYLISNLLNMALTMLDFLSPSLYISHWHLYRLVSDIASVLTVLGNVIRCPAQVISNREIRENFSSLLCGRFHEPMVADERRRCSSQMINAPWLSLYIVPAERRTTESEELSKDLVRRKSVHLTETPERQFLIRSTMENSDRRRTYSLGNNQLLCRAILLSNYR